MQIGILKETAQGEFRVALTPTHAKQLLTMGYKVCVESGAGLKPGFDDQAYQDVGATVEATAASVIESAAVIIAVRPPVSQVAAAPASFKDKILISFLQNHLNEGISETFAATGANFWALERVPRISRAQNMDVLSSMANLLGYRAVVEASASFGRLMGGQITAAGRIPPAKVLVIGAGVAGLAAIGQSRSLGAIVRAFDTRLEVRDQIKSMGAEFLTVDIEEDGSGTGGYAKTMSPEFIAAEMELFKEQCKDVDIVITTAQIPGKKAPTLITSEMVKVLKKGSVVIDLAAEQGGNCEATKPGEKISHDGVIIDGRTDLLASMAGLASELFGRNILELLKLLNPIEAVPYEDIVVDHAMICRNGKVHQPTTELPKTPAPKKTSTQAPAPAQPQKKSGAIQNILLTTLAILAATGAIYAPHEFLHHLMVFILACVIGWQVIWNVTPALHTPLMSVTNAISGIIVLGGLLQFTNGANDDPMLSWISIGAVFLATLNIFGGFYVTQRMLVMFRRKG
jgi:H+-translocating NAD(P) transhydrogenase subunit alpha